MNTLSVLIVDDEADLRQSLNDDLQEMGYRVSTATNGQEALDLMAIHKIDIVLSDLNMPVLSGSKLLQQLRQNGFRNPFIVLSGHGSRAEVIELMRLEAFDFIEKPATYATLEKVLSAAAHSLNMVELAERNGA